MGQAELALRAAACVPLPAPTEPTSRRIRRPVDDAAGLPPGSVTG